MRCLLLATRDHLRVGLGLPDDPLTCEVTADGRPLPMAGEVFYAVHPGGSANSNVQNLMETYTVYVTVTRRIGQVPYDRVGTDVLAAASDGLLALAEAARAVLHEDFALTYAATALLPAGWHGYDEALVYRDTSAPTPRTGQWFQAKAATESGLSVTVRVEGALRVQRIESINQEPDDDE